MRLAIPLCENHPVSALVSVPVETQLNVRWKLSHAIKCTPLVDWATTGRTQRGEEGVGGILQISEPTPDFVQ